MSTGNWQRKDNVQSTTFSHSWAKSSYNWWLRNYKKNHQPNGHVVKAKANKGMQSVCQKVQLYTIDKM